MRLPSFGPGLAGLLLAAAASRAAPPRPLAVVVSKRLRSMDAALAGARRVARRHGTKLRVYRLDEGANQVDRAAAALTRGTLGGVVSLGAAARGFVDERTRGGVNHVATLVLPDPARPVDQAWVRFDASPEEWTQLAGLLSEPGAPVGALASDDLAEARLRPLAAALQGAGHRLVVRRASGTQGLTRALRELLDECRLLILPRDRGLLSEVVIRQVMGRAFAAKVPVVSFSRGLLAAGATATLDLSPEACGAHAAQRALGLEPEPLRATLKLDRNRARHLGIPTKAELEAWLQGEEWSSEE